MNKLNQSLLRGGAFCLKGESTFPVQISGRDKSRVHKSIMVRYIMGKVKALCLVSKYFTLNVGVGETPQQEYRKSDSE